ncbi:hypothetical protein [Bradyrhizobium prioriisuperbiae]|uniref:hypothetical protein n=1 Tax=Bradyrhizobium prioriisuperbiae TaxID=2854389 RepID=UPI0028EA3361|nr:hypothetical protein [Bradyrhizobium prioritasuperba]
MLQNELELTEGLKDQIPAICFTIALGADEQDLDPELTIGFFDRTQIGDERLLLDLAGMAVLLPGPDDDIHKFDHKTLDFSVARKFFLRDRTPSDV